MLDTFEILTTSGVVLWSRTYAPVSPSVINHFIADVFIEEKSSVAAANDGGSAATNPPYKYDQHTLRWTLEKELGIIFVAVYRSLLHLSWIDKLVDNIRAIFVSLYGDQLKKPNTTIVECLKFDEYFDQQLHELEQSGSKSDSKDLRALKEQDLSDDEPPLPPGLTQRIRPRDNTSKDLLQADLTPVATPNSSRPSTPASNHLLVAKGGPVAKISRRARKGQNSNAAAASSGDEASRKTKAKSTKRGRKWDADGFADVDDSDVQLDYSAPKGTGSDNDGETTARSAGLEEVDASTWGSTTKGKFVLKDLGDEVHSILASAEAKKPTSSKTDAGTGVVGSSLSAISGLFRNVVGGKVLTREDLDKAMKGMEEHLLKKNVAREAAVRLCEGVEKELVGVKTGSFESINARIQKAMEASLTKMLTPTSSLDLLREIDSITAPSATSLRKARPYVMSIVGVNGVGKSTNLSKICFFLLQNRYKVLIAAGDTFRSGAVEQLAVHVRNLKELTAREGGKVELYQKGYGKDAATVAKDAVTFAAQEGFDVVLIDTAGRRHNDQRLMSSLEKFAKFAQPDKILMVGEALVGTDSVAQARNFNAAFGAGRSLDGFIISKCDTVGDMVGTLVSITFASTAKGHMAPESYGNAAFPGQGPQHGLARLSSSSAAAAAGPPPSTLAAQLVENMRKSTQSVRSLSSGPDESGELKRFFSIIDSVKNNPAILKTEEEQVEHNHMLIYVCGLVLFGNLDWDEPFADQDQLREKALKAIHLLEATIKETPQVLTRTTDGNVFLFHGKEPLWLWILPKVLTMLGRSKCLAISTAIEELCQYIFQLTSVKGSLWDLGLPLMKYFQANLATILAKLNTTTLLPRNAPIEIELPSKDFFLKTLAFDTPPQGCSFVVTTLEQAVRHAIGLLAIIKNAVLPHNGSQISPTFGHVTTWLLDVLQPLASVQSAWPMPPDVSLTPIVRIALHTAATQGSLSMTDAILCQKANSVLVAVCTEVFEQSQQLISQEKSGESLRDVTCAALIHLAKEAIAHRPISRLVIWRLLTPAQTLVSENAIVGTDTDIWRAVQLLSQTTAKSPPSALSEDVRSEKFTDRLLCQQVKKLGLEPADDQPAEPPSKRMKLSGMTSESCVWAELCRLLNDDSKHIDQANVNQYLSDTFPHMDEARQCQVIELTTRYFCAIERTLEITRERPGMPTRLHCSFCSGSESTEENLTRHDNKPVPLNMFTTILRLPSFLESRRPRIIAMIGLRRLARHSRWGELGAEFWDLGRSAAGQWCLQSLQSSIRELRVAAGRTLSVFLSETGVDGGIIERNRANALGLLKKISDKNATHLHETCILTWGQVGRVVGDNELNLVLIKLIEYLGHRSEIVQACAFSEILNLAQSLGVTTRRLFQPFWPSLAFSVVKDLISQPQTTKLVAELLQMSDQALLRLIQADALPWLVLTKKQDVIQKIAEVRGETETWQPCLDSLNLPSILALLLIQDAPDIAEHSMSLLKQVSPHFDGLALVELLRTEPLGIALQLFKASGEADDARKARVRAALAKMVTLLTAGDDKEKKPPKKAHLIGRFLQHHALGLVARLSEVINDSFGVQPPVLQQKHCLAAMEEFIRVCNSYACIARPQISACLISALSSDELRPAAFSCWEVMLTHMEEPDVEAQIENTFFIITQYWKWFDVASRRRVKTLITTLLDKYHHILSDFANKLPSLSHIDELSDLAKKLDGLRSPLDTRETFGVFIQRLNHENPGVVEQTLAELVDFLGEHQDYLQVSAVSEQPDSIVTDLTRSLLDCSSKYNVWQPGIVRLCAESIGLIGCLDSNRLETTREQRQFVVAFNFEDAGETTDFVVFLLENVLVKAFLSTTDTKFIGFLSYAMQELLDRADFRQACSTRGGGMSEHVYRKWLAMSDNSREVLTPFLSSGFSVIPLPEMLTDYPIFRPGRPYSSWIRALVSDLLRNGQTPFSHIIFEPLYRLIKVKDLMVAEFLLPYLVLHVVVGQENSSEFRDKMTAELSAILQYQPPETASYVEREEIKLYYQTVFRIIDYFMRWLQVKKSQQGLTARDETWIKWAEGVIQSLDHEQISQRAVDCGEYARALFFLEPHMDSRCDAAEEAEASRLTQTIQYIYTQIDDPDGLEGVSASIRNVDLDQQALNHRKAGRWTAAQTWYEIRLSEAPENIDIQLDLLTCLKESGQYDVVLNYIEGINRNPETVSKLVPFAVEASWVTSRWQTLEKYLRLYTAGDISEVFNLGIAQALLHLRDGDLKSFGNHVQMMRDTVAGSLSYSSTSSLRTCHDGMLRCHVLSDLEMIANEKGIGNGDQQAVIKALERRLEVLGAYVGNKQYVLGIWRAAMELMRPKFGNDDISTLWLSSARLARKAGSMHQSFNAVLRAQQLGDGSAIIENARLLYKDGHHRKAIQVLEIAISTESFIGNSVDSGPPTSSKNPEMQRSLLTARAYLLLAKWLDSTGQTHASALRSKYQQAAKAHSQWEKGHYYLGRHYKKVLESEKTLKPDDQSDEYLTGETAKLVIENYLRSLNFGTKYLYQTLPRILTLWLELGAQVDKPPEGKVSPSRQLHLRRKAILHDLYKHFLKHLPRMPAYLFYTALPQIVARIAHPNTEVFTVLEQMIIKVVEAHPRQSLWSLFSFMTTREQSDRRTRGRHILKALQSIDKRVDGGAYDLKQMLRSGEKLAEQLLLACNNGDFQSNRTTTASITRDLHFNHKCTPCPLVVPIEACLAATLPTLTDNVRKHKAFSRDVITIDSFLDHVLVLGSLAKPRKLTAQGSDGKKYGLLIKPKDDLRTDQRLMEFNGMINRSLKRDAESSRRQLYIKTYAVTPLNEECGIIEWVDGLKTLRDILLGIYKTRGIAPNYGHIAQLMKEASLSDANVRLFTETVIGMFPPVLPDWFISQFPTPSAWFAARLKYTRSCAVMSMVGTILGLGDRHGENVLLEEGNGGIFHVDFNCLFDKGLTFAQPERVPFRLTHNMVAAMGSYGYEGPFRHCSELTLRILRQQEETLMTILEAFIHDPTLDLQRTKKREVVKLNPTSVVESIKRKVRGLLPEESIPLGVEGQVEELIKQAVDPRNLAAMYIGWCPFL
ncbi:hypothetical protein B0T19DRAFT_489276 [Cercophora scortea]|uniref:Serine/threonine-protein kinase MEC1 n=1 Tax=Cercophora scortea TaxID=314031 RepID=A0AAE0J1Y7_9PEZI|nr:hypothetical protein B0T19DRAFT_489276 [Cercophora scortea]